MNLLKFKAVVLKSPLNQFNFIRSTQGTTKFSPPSFRRTQSIFKWTHSTAWKWEKIVVLSLLPIIPVSLFLQDKATDTILATLTAVHMHQGLSSITMDYVKKFPRVAKIGVFGLSAATLAGLMFMIHLRGQGLVLTLRRVWAIEPFKERDGFDMGYEYMED